MKLTKKLLVTSAVALLLAPSALTSAQEQATEWKIRTVEQVKKDLEIKENETVYTIQYGDTLSVIAEALDLELAVLGRINSIEDLDLIFSGNVLTTTYDNDNNASTLTIEAPTNDADELAQVAEVNLVDNEVVLADETIALPEVEAEVIEAYINEPVTEWVPVETTTEVAVEETTQVAAPVVVETTEVAEWIVEPTTESTTETTVTTVEELVTEVAPVAVETETSVVEPVVAEAETSVAESVEVTEVTEAVVVEAPTTTEAPEIIETTVEVPVVEEVIPETIVEEVTVAPVYDVYANPENAGLQAHVAAFKEEIAATYGITSFSTYRPGDPGDHGKGLAVDFMVPVGSDIGDAIANYAASLVGSTSISYVIWEQQIYGDWNYTWEMMEDRGGITANHYDHVHVSFYAQ